MVLSGPRSVAVDTVNNELLVGHGSTVAAYGRTANGNVTPLRTISGAATGLNGADGLAVDTVNNEVVVVSGSIASVRVYSRTANGNVAPLRTLSGAATELGGPFTPAITTEGAPIPTLSEWALVAMVALLFVSGLLALRRHPAAG